MLSILLVLTLLVKSSFADEGTYACCDVAGGCTDTSLDDCAYPLFGYPVDTRACVHADVVCPSDVGACCDGWWCYLSKRSDCGGVYQGDGIPCADSCPSYRAVGACCNGGCYLSTESECLDGVYQGDGIPCGDSCPPTNNPTPAPTNNPTPAPTNNPTPCFSDMIGVDCSNNPFICPYICMECRQVRSGGGINTWIYGGGGGVTAVCDWKIGAAQSILNNINTVDDDMNGVSDVYEYPMYSYILLVGAILFVLINNLFIGYYCVCKKNNTNAQSEQYEKCDIVVDE